MKKIIVFSAMILSCITISKGQPGPGPLTGPPTPIDGGFSILLAAGIGLGYRSFKRNGN